MTWRHRLYFPISSVQQKKAVVRYLENLGLKPRSQEAAQMIENRTATMIIFRLDFFIEVHLVPRTYTGVAVPDSRCVIVDKSISWERLNGYFQYPRI